MVVYCKSVIIWGPTKIFLVCSTAKLNINLPATYWLFNYLRWATPTWRSLFTGHSRRWAGSRIITRISSWRYSRWTSLATSSSFMTISASTPPSGMIGMLLTTASFRWSWTITFVFYFRRSLRSCQFLKSIVDETITGTLTMPFPKPENQNE